MIDDRLLDERMKFFDYIYPRLSQQIDDLKKGQEFFNRKMIEISEERKYYVLMIEQYKKKIQRIEQMLIEHGLIRLLGKNRGNTDWE